MQKVCKNSNPQHDVDCKLGEYSQDLQTGVSPKNKSSYHFSYKFYACSSTGFPMCILDFLKDTIFKQGILTKAFLNYSLLQYCPVSIIDGNFPKSCIVYIYIGKVSLHYSKLCLRQFQQYLDLFESHFFFRIFKKFARNTYNFQILLS